MPFRRDGKRVRALYPVDTYLPERWVEMPKYDSPIFTQSARLALQGDVLSKPLLGEIGKKGRGLLPVAITSGIAPTIDLPQNVLGFGARLRWGERPVLAYGDPSLAAVDADLNDVARSARPAPRSKPPQVTIPQHVARLKGRYRLRSNFALRDPM